MTVQKNYNDDFKVIDIDENYFKEVVIKKEEPKKKKNDTVDSYS